MKSYRSIKISIGFSVAFLLSTFLGLDFSISAGIICILNMLDIKRESLLVTWKRLFSSIIGLPLFSFIYILIEYRLISLILFIIIITLILFKLNAREGIAVNIVLASHLLELKSFTYNNLSNELFLVLIAYF